MSATLQNFRDYCKSMVFMRTRSNHQGFCKEQFLLAHGKFGKARMPIDKGMFMTPKECINNSITKAAEEPGLGYIEGLACALVPCDHAWNYELGIPGFTNWIDFTWDNSDREATYFGVEIPNEILLMAIYSVHWTHCCGVLQTLQTFNPQQLADAIEIMPALLDGILDLS